MKIQMTQKSNLGGSKSMVGWTKESVFSPRYTTNQAMECTHTDLNVPSLSKKTWKCIVRSGKQAILTQRKQRSGSWWKKNWDHNIWYVYPDGFITSDQAGWGFTVKQGTTNTRENSAVYKVKTSSLTMGAKTVMNNLHWITPRCSSQAVRASVLSHSVKIRMENSRIGCNNVWPQSLKTCRTLMVGMVGSIELMK